MTRKTLSFVLHMILFAVVYFTFPVFPTDSHPLLGLSDEVVLAKGTKLQSTAKAEQAKIIGTLLESARKSMERAETTIDYPTDQSVFPPEIVAPTFLWHDTDEKVDTWLIDVELKKEGQHIYVLVPGKHPPKGEIDPMCVVDAIKYEPPAYQLSARSWTPSDEVWNFIKKQSVETAAEVTVFGFNSANPTAVRSMGRMSMKTSADPVGAPVFYRDVPLVPSKTKIGKIAPLAEGSLPLINWRLRDISRPRSRVLLKDMPTCANCHSFSSDGKYLAMDLDGPTGDKGAYFISPITRQMVVKKEDVMSWNSFEGKPEKHNTLGFLSQISPDGEYIISTVNEALYVSNFLDFKFLQVFYPTRGILAYYSMKEKKVKALPGADDPQYVHCDGVWSPDGKYIVFARARAMDPYRKDQEMAKYANDPAETQIKYDLYRLDFNKGRGGTAVPIEGASQNGMSNSFPKVSPDGKWIVFVKSKNGQLMRPDGRLWIVPVGGGKAREMKCNTWRMNSWHSFSPNGRWMVFSSKANTPYTQMFLTHIDGNGNDTPPILVPNCTADNRAVNIPEFVNISYESLASIEVPIVRYHTFYQEGDKLFKKGKLEEAIQAYLKSIENNPQFDKAHYNLGASLFNLKKYDEAIAHFKKVAELNPMDANAYYNWANALVHLGKLDEAAAQYGKLLEIEPRHKDAHFMMASILSQLNRFDDAVYHYGKAIEISPGEGNFYIRLADTLLRLGRFAGAVEQYKKGFAFTPNDPIAQLNCGNALFSLRELDEAVEYYKKALTLNPQLADAYLNWGNILFIQKKYEAAIEQYKKVLQINPGDRDAKNNIGFAEDALKKQGQ
jgi:tetratricopeptide (TPR) repeat protein